MGNSTEIPAGISAGNPAKTSTGIPARIPAGIPAAIPKAIPAVNPAAILCEKEPMPQNNEFYCSSYAEHHLISNTFFRAYVISRRNIELVFRTRNKV